LRSDGGPGIRDRELGAPLFLNPAGGAGKGVGKAGKKNKMGKLVPRWCHSTPFLLLIWAYWRALAFTPWCA
jgi:hypothetical protein